MKQTDRKKQTGRKSRKRNLPVGNQGLQGAVAPKDMVLNSKVRDSGSKTIFDDPILCSQFLRGYVNIPCLKDIRPEDIEDVSERYVTLFAEERNSDSVKRVRIRDGEAPFFLVSLIEHKTSPDYNVCMQIFRYMVYIWEAYEKEAEQKRKGASKLAGFLYPPILPIVYYEGPGEWHVPLEFISRIREGAAFGEYIPNFKYYLVPLREYSNEALIKRGDGISMAMMFSKLQTPEDIERFRKLPAEEIDAVIRGFPEHQMGILADILKVFLLKMNVSVQEMEKLVEKVKEKKMGGLFAGMEKMDIQAERRNTAEARKRADEAEKRADEAEKLAEEAQKRAEEAQKKMEEEYRKLEEKLKALEEKLQIAEESIRRMT